MFGTTSVLKLNLLLPKPSSAALKHIYLVPPTALDTISTHLATADVVRLTNVYSRITVLMSGTRYHLILSAHQHCPHLSHGSKDIIFLLICQNLQFSIWFYISYVFIFFLFLTLLVFDCIILCIRVSCMYNYGSVSDHLGLSAFFSFDLIWFIIIIFLKNALGSKGSRGLKIKFKNTYYFIIIIFFSSLGINDPEGGKKLS